MNLRKPKKIISTSLIILLLMPIIFLYNPKYSNAQDPVTGTIISLPVKDVGWKAWLRTILLGSAAGSSSVTAGQTTATTVLLSKEEARKIISEALKVVARRTLAKMTESTVNWINTGFHGAPLFVENPESFFKDIAKSEIRNLVNIVGYNSSSFPFGKNAALNTIQSYKNTFAQNAQYSLSKVTNDPVLLNNFRKDFRVGGWDGFLLQTQFPQNNPIGFQMMYSDELARRLEGTSTNKAGIVQQTLEQGQGFLSPQTCVTNPYYDNLTNPFTKKPSQDPGVGIFITGRPPELLDCNSVAPQYKKDCEARNVKTLAEYNANEAKNRAESLQSNKAYCPNKPDGSSGFVNTTPGSVVAGQIINSLTSPQRQGELSQALGNSLSAIFDALLNKLFSAGLNSLSNKINGSGSSTSNNNFDDYGNTLGTDPSSSTSSGSGFNWNTPDTIITLSGLKTDIQNAINSATAELKAIDSTDVNNPGVLQTFEKIWPKTQELDICLPGPNIGFKTRIDEELQRTIADGTDYDAQLASGNVFKDWITNKMNIELPSSISYINSVNSIKTTNNQATELKTRKNTLVDMLITLNSINSELSTISSEPSTGSTNEATLIRLKQRYDGLLSNISSSATVNDAKNKLADAKDKLNNLDTLIKKCGEERIVKGWSNPGGANSTTGAGIVIETEKSVFCSAYPGGAPVSCDVVFQTSLTDYK